MASVAERISYVEAQVNQHEHLFEDIRGTLQRLESRGDRHFLWLIGVQMTTLIAIIGALLARP